MINGKDNPVEWAQLGYEIEEVIEHLQQLSNRFEKNSSIDDSDFEVQVGHVFAHLNRIWNSRNRIGEADERQFELESQFPIDLTLVG